MSTASCRKSVVGFFPTPDPGPLANDCCSFVRLRSARRLGDAIERRVGVGANGLDRRQTDDDDQRQHNRVLHRGGAIFRNQETLHLQSETLHCFLRSDALRKAVTPFAPQKLSPPGTATRTSRRPASHRNETQTSFARLVISNRLLSA